MSLLLKVAEYVTPVLKESKFKETGVITPDEFVIAGDHLVHHCPTWQWQTGDKTRLKSYLPPNKQFLITRQVHCSKRYKDLESIKFQEKIIDENDDEGGWVDAHVNESNIQNDADDDDIVLGVEVTEDDKLIDQVRDLNVNENQGKNEKDDDDSEAEDFETYMNQQQTLNDEHDECVVDVTKLPQQLNSGDNNKNVIQTRTYDLFITYDKYYQTPRLWLSGFDEYLQPLSIEQMYEDISQDHAKKTVTMEWHPNIPTMMASIHPCRHAEMMKKIMTTMEENEKHLEVDRYLIVFLKFVQSVIPTIQYDYTQNVCM
ncbi:ubiquitin-like protein-conjugating enzyme ATG3-like protein [Euroglyphus maynei]|uniref:Ubiquitin-like-conjugating enzyme ATG3 n=1 Tax=Euroglyphus maynei TaxID=6958 RepID=A0A1Y3BE00_EURMA|nr:ubiquitin-like protein-conjugating enzyme ATG3-like protein [Euroglyphus maynei]